MTAKYENPNDIKVAVGVKMHPDDILELDEICGETDRSRSWVAYKLYLRGLEAYKKDHKFQSPAQERQERALRKIKTA
jgi:hypothetical protein